jgi:hypothetical protein
VEDGQKGSKTMTSKLHIGRVLSLKLSRHGRLLGIVIAIACVTQVAGPLSGQNTFPSNGNVGIGTTSPSSLLTLGNGSSSLYLTLNGPASGTNNGAGIAFQSAGTYTSYVGDYSSWFGGPYNSDLLLHAINTTNNTIHFATTGSDKMVILQNGNVGIGTTTPQGNLNVVSGGATYVNIGNASTGDTYGQLFTNALSNGYFGIQSIQAQGTTWGNIILNGSGGNVGIGTPAPAHPLQVAGIIGAEEVIVSSTGPDYVFKPDYHLSPLSEVASYIKENHLLPGIPSADEVQTNGVSLGDMQTKMLAKVEELTLYMIQADEQNQKLQARIASLEARLANREVKDTSTSGETSGH